MSAHTSPNRNDAVEFFSRGATDFHASYDGDANRLERLRVWRDVLDRYATNAQTAYDLGCGSGILAVELGKRGISTVGIDGAEGMLAIAQRLAEGEGCANVRFEQRRLPLENPNELPRADLVVSSSVLEYLESVDVALGSFRDLLAPEGTLIFSISNRASLSRKVVSLVHKLTGRPRYFSLIRNMVTSEEIDSHLRRVGLVRVALRYFGGADRLNRLLAHLVPPRRASNMLIVVARCAPDHR